MDMSTIDPLTTDRLQAAALAHGLSVVDAPVGRLAEHADRGESLFMVGASDADLARVRPLLDAMGTTVHHCGGVGTGGRTKLVNNFVAVTLTQVNAEALALSQRFGLDIARTLAVLLGTSANNGQLRMNLPARCWPATPRPASPSTWRTRTSRWCSAPRHAGARADAGGRRGVRVRSAWRARAATAASTSSGIADAKLRRREDRAGARARRLEAMPEGTGQRAPASSDSTASANTSGTSWGMLCPTPGATACVRGPVKRWPCCAAAGGRAHAVVGAVEGRRRAP
jgi:hypothetical protein